MSLERKFYTQENISHEKYGNFVIIKQKEKTVSKAEAIEYTTYTKKNLKQLYKEKQIVGLAGPISAGKTTLTEQIADWTGSNEYREETKSSGLYWLYSRMDIVAGAFQFDVGLQREHVLRAADKTKGSSIIDRSIYEDPIFANMFCGSKLISPYMYSQIMEFYEKLSKRNKQLDVVVWIKASKETLETRAKERNRTIEMGGKKILSEEKIKNMEKKKVNFQNYIQKYAPLEFKEYMSKQNELKVSKEIIFPKLPEGYLTELDACYEKLFKSFLEKFGFTGVLVELDVDPQIGENGEEIDARERDMGRLPLMRVLKEATILNLLRNRYKEISELPNKKGLKIVRPWEKSY